MRGDDASGKTSLSQELYLQFVKDKKSPLLLQVDMLSRSKIDRIIKYAVMEQYGDELFDKFNTLPIDNKILLIDDIDMIKNRKPFDDFLKIAKEQFSLIILFTKSEVMELKELLQKKIDSEESIDLVITPFFMDKRKELIRNIIKLMDSYTASDVDEKVEIIDKSIKNQLKYFNLTPQFIIMYVETYLNQSFSLEGNTNVYNAVFQANITNIVKSIEGTTVTRTLQLLQQIAYYIHSNKRYPLPFAEFVSIVENFNRNHPKGLNASKFAESLVKIGFIKINAKDEVYMSSKYYLAYFVAKAINSMIGTEEGNKQIEYLLKNLCFGINSDILLFLSFLTDRKDIIKLIEFECDSFLSEWIENDLDSKNLNCLFIDFNAPSISYPNSKQKAQRSNDIVSQEKKTIKSERIETFDLYDYNPEEISYYVNKQKKVLKLIEIIAKILPNFEHMLDKDELFSLSDKLYTIPNMLSYYMLKPFDDNFEETVEEVIEVYNKCVSEEKQITKPQGVLFMQDFMTAVILSLFDFTAQLSATDETYEILMDKKYSSSLSNQLQQCLVLYHFNDLEKLGRRLEDIYDKTKYQSIKFMILKIARNYLMKKNISYVGYEQRFIDKFFPEGKTKLLTQKQTV